MTPLHYSIFSKLAAAFLFCGLFAVTPLKAQRIGADLQRIYQSVAAVGREKCPEATDIGKRVQEIKREADHLKNRVQITLPGQLVGINSDLQDLENAKRLMADAFSKLYDGFTNAENASAPFDYSHNFDGPGQTLTAANNAMHNAAQKISEAMGTFHDLAAALRVFSPGSVYRGSIAAHFRDTYTNYVDDLHNTNTHLSSKIGVLQMLAAVVLRIDPNVPGNTRGIYTALFDLRTELLTFEHPYFVQARDSMFRMIDLITWEKDLTERERNEITGTADNPGRIHYLAQEAGNQVLAAGKMCRYGVIRKTLELDRNQLPPGRGIFSSTPPPTPHVTPKPTRTPDG